MSNVFRYNGSVVGSIEKRQGLTVFEWAQVPFQVFSTTETVVYGMSYGLKNKLEESDIDVVEVDNGAVVPVDTIDGYETVYPTHAVFSDNPPSEAQKLIRVKRDG